MDIMGKKHNTTQDDYIADINTWLRERVNNKTTLNPAIIRYRYIEKKIYEICEELDVTKTSVKLVTLRSSFCKEQKYLRPIYSKPDALRGYFVDPERQIPFSFSGNFKNIFAKVETTFDIKKNILPEVFAAYYALNPNYLCKKDGCSIQPPNSFATRIDTFWKGMEFEKDEKYSELKKIAKNINMNCIFAGLNKNKNVSKLVELEHIVAIYFKKKGYKLKDKKFQKIKNISSKLFEEIDLIAKLDYNLFKKEGLEIVADKIIPVFSNTSIAPADKISTAIRILEEHLGKHLVGRQMEKSPPKVFYLSASFEQKESNIFFPHLNVYPLCYRSDYPIGSYQVAHKYIPSATKFLLYKYLTSKNIKVKFGGDYSDNDIAEQEYIKAEFDKEFNSLFDDNKLFGDKNPKLDYSNWFENIWVEENPDQLHMVSHDEKWKNFSGKTPWNVLNRFLAPDKENNSIVAFIVEGDELPDENGCRCRTFPRGVLAIESSHVDAFSDGDIEALGILAKTISSLIRQITHRNSSLDFRSNLTHAFNNKYNLFNCGQWGEDRYRQQVTRIMLVVHKIDVKELHKLCKKIDNAISQNYKETEAIYNTYKITDEDFEQIKNLSYKFKDYDNKEILDEKLAAKVINERFENLFEWLRNHPTELVSDRVIDFFEACPENFVWAGFFMSLGQALGDRVSTKIPSFSFMTPGYSASSMFMATVQGELRQVVKLSSKEKLEKERNKYSKYVRYRLVNSARIPQNGYAFDTRGKKGKDDTETEEDIPYGALVSDLVSGEVHSPNYIVTLIGIITYTFLFSDKANIPEIADVNKKLKMLFKDGLSLWQTKGQDNYQAIPDVLKSAGASMARKAFRLPQTWNIEQCCKKLDKHSTNEEKYQYNLYKAYCKFNNVIGNDSEGIKSIDTMLNEESIPMGYGVDGDNLIHQIASIGHGDLNARNLTWSGGLESFFMIDFEHVDYYFIGADQYRLAVNLVVNIVGEVYEAEQNNNDIDERVLKLCIEIDRSVQLITKFHKNLSASAVTEYANLFKEEYANLFKEENSDEHKRSKCHLSSVILTLFYTLKDIFYKKNQSIRKTQWFMQFYGYVLFCSVLKELDYSCHALDDNDSTLQNIIHTVKSNKEKGLLEVTSFELLKIIRDKLGKQYDRRLCGLYFRHLISAKMLYMILQ